MAGAIAALGAVWYLIATQLVIPHFNHGNQAFYLQNFFGDYGGTFPGIARTILRHPNWVVRDAVQHDRIVFYKKLLWPLGWMPLASPLHLLMALPQMLASVIGGQVYARRIEYQYTADHDRPVHDRGGRGGAQRGPLDAPLAAPTAALGRARRLAGGMRLGHQRGLVAVAGRRAVRRVGPAQPAGRGDAVGGRPGAEGRRGHVVLRHRPAPVPARAAPTTGRTRSGRRTGARGPRRRPTAPRFPSASIVDYLVLDMNLYPDGDPQRQFIESLIAPGGEFSVVRWRQDIDDNVLVARRVEPGPDGVARRPTVRAPTRSPRPDRSARRGVAARRRAHRRRERAAAEPPRQVTDDVR